MKLINLFFILSLFICFFSKGQQLNQYYFEELDSLQKTEPRPVFVFIHTDWCRYCAKMDVKTFSDTSISILLNQNFYFVKLNAEQRKPITFKNHTFNFVPKGLDTGIHELAYELGNINGILSYPTIVILNSNSEIIGKNDSYLNTKQLLPILKSVD